MRQLHVVRRAGDSLARDVVRHQLGAGDEVRVVLVQDAAGDEEPPFPPGAEVFSMPPLQYDQLVEHIAWSQRVVNW